MADQKDAPPPRIYVACLASYNAGTLHGAWIDAAREPEAIMADIQAMLAASPEPGAEEWAIHDYEGFGGYGVSDHEDIATVSRLALLIEQHGALFAGVLGHCGDIDEAERMMEECYQGEWDSVADYAENLTRDSHEIPDFLEYYIDWDRMARDMELGGDVFTVESSKGVHVFWNM